MSKSIKLFKAIKVTVNDESKEIAEGGFPAVWKFLRMDSPAFHENQIAIVRELMCFCECDISELYHNKAKVVLSIVPCDD